jgi:hypothetical protein
MLPENTMLLAASMFHVKLLVVPAGIANEPDDGTGTSQKQMLLTPQELCGGHAPQFPAAPAVTYHQGGGGGKRRR